MATCKECKREVDGIAYYGFCSQECFNTYMARRNSGYTGYTSMQGQQPQNKISIHDVLKNGKISGTICMDGFNFAIVCDNKIDPDMFALAAAAFRDTFTQKKI